MNTDLGGELFLLVMKLDAAGVGASLLSSINSVLCVTLLLLNLESRIKKESTASTIRLLTKTYRVSVYIFLVVLPFLHISLIIKLIRGPHNSETVAIRATTLGLSCAAIVFLVWALCRRTGSRPYSRRNSSPSLIDFKKRPPSGFRN